MILLLLFLNSFKTKLNTHLFFIIIKNIAVYIIF